MPFENIPTELLLEIFSYLGSHELLHLQQVSDRLYEIATDRSLVENYFQDRYDVSDEKDCLSNLCYHADMFSKHTLLWYLGRWKDQINQQDDRYGDTPLTSCLWNIECDNQYHLLPLLLEDGADPNLKNREGHTPLTILAHCADRNYLETTYDTMQLLLEAGADPNLSFTDEDVDEYGEWFYIENASPISILIIKGCQGSVDLVRLLLDYGAIPETIQHHNSRRTTNHVILAVEYNRVDILDLLLERAEKIEWNKFNKVNNSWVLQLIKSVKTKDVLDVFIKHGLDIKKSSRYLFNFALLHGSLDYINYLFKIGIQPTHGNFKRLWRKSLPFFNTSTKVKISHMIFKNGLRENPKGYPLIYQLTHLNPGFYLARDYDEDLDRQLRVCSQQEKDLLQVYLKFKHQDLICHLIDNHKRYHVKLDGDLVHRIFMYVKNTTSRKEIIQTLIRNKVDLMRKVKYYMKSNSHFTPLQLCINCVKNSGYINNDVVELYKDRVTFEDTLVKESQSILQLCFINQSMVISSHQFKGILDRIPEEWVQVNYQDPTNGKTCLHYFLEHRAAFYTYAPNRSKTILKTLLELGGDLSIADHKGITPADIITQKGWEQYLQDTYNFTQLARTVQLARTTLIGEGWCNWLRKRIGS